MTTFSSRMTAFLIAGRIWLLTSLVLGLGWLLYSLFFETYSSAWIGPVAGLCALAGSLPVLVVLAVVIPRIETHDWPQDKKIQRLVLTAFICTLPYGFICGGFFTSSFRNDNHWLEYPLYSLAASAILFACSSVAMLLAGNSITRFFSSYHHNHSFTQINQQMDTEQLPYAMPAEKAHSKTFTKGLITGALILLMMIPTLFVINLVTERQKRQEEVVKEVSSKWASEQTIAGPYLYIPYTASEMDDNKKIRTVSKHLLLLPDNLDITGTITPEIRPRSIYKVLLYKSSLKNNGNFTIRIPKDINIASLQLADAKICFGISDFKGIEEKIAVNFKAINYELSPGLPASEIDVTGLSAPVSLTTADIGSSINFNMQLKIKGSEQLHVVPLSGNSTVALSSTWPTPSFDGNNLPGERNVDEHGFTAKWVINKANLPFGTVLRGAAFDKNSFAFGVSMLQPADQYAKTMRSVKYAILFIGLTFSLFFIVELMQKKPLHPVQYVLVGLALVIFYTLLLSFSEFILFDQAYAIASAATIMLITLYAKSHFESWKTASLFGGVLCGLYGFIFILIRLEDTALLVGSIGLFLVLAIVMYASRKINWYNATINKNNIASA
ncbi:MAG: cell envelope integrity protein CreD [Chitinophagaceae bacterium]